MRIPANDCRADPQVLRKLVKRKVHHRKLQQRKVMGPLRFLATTQALRRNEWSQPYRSRFASRNVTDRLPRGESSSRRGRTIDSSAAATNHVAASALSRPANESASPSNSCGPAASTGTLPYFLPEACG